MTIPPDYAQVNLRFTGSAVPTGAEVTFGIEIPDGSIAPSIYAASVASAFNTANIDNDMATGCDMTSVLVKFGPDATGPSGEAVGGTPGTGGTAGAAAPAILMQKRTNFGGRKGRGRCFWPGVPEASINPGGEVHPTSVAAWQSHINAFFADLAGDGLNHVLLHGDATVPYPVIATPVMGIVATQRRRQRR